MRDVPLRGTPFSFVCIRCGVRTDSRQQGACADLDGIPFLAFYCGRCAIVRRAERAQAAIVQGPIAEVRDA